jgi:uncharacterized YkwD family protein
MKKKIIALSLTAVIALSSTSVFAATTNCTALNNKNAFNIFIKNYESKCANTNKENLLTVNGKKVDLNSIDWKTVLKQCMQAEKSAPVEEPDTSAPTPAPDTSVEEPAASTENNATVSSSNLTYEQKVVELVNVERQEAGLPELKMDSAISNVARAKSKDMAVNNYFAHQSPTYGSAGDMLRQYGISWSAWGENIASGQRTPEIVVNAWMNSPGHRANILSANFSKIGVGYVTNSNGTPYWTQMFTN